MKKLFIGIDFAKKKFDATLLIAIGLEEIGNRSYGSFENDTKGYRAFLKWVKTNSLGCSTDEWLFCGENTGACSLGLSKWLYGRGYDIWIEDAYSIKHSSGIQRVKSDKADSAMIAEYAWRYQDKVMLFEPLEDSLQQLREVFLYRHKIVQQRAALIVRKEEKQICGKSKAMSFIERKNKQIITQLSKVIAECDKRIDQIIDSDPALKENYEVITSIPGVARQNGTCLIVFTRNFKRFDFDSRKIACYYGVAPFGKQSGTSINTPAHTSHFANKLIKSLLSQSALIATVHCPEIKAYYNRLIVSGKKHQVALNNVKNKLLRIITALVRKKVKYDPDTYKFYENRMCQQSNVNITLNPY